MARGAREAGWLPSTLPLADGGEGTLAVFGGANRHSVVRGPLGDPVEAGWRLDGTRAVIEMAAASGLDLVGGRSGNDPLRATTHGTGELVRDALESGARDLIVCLGGSATTDGGSGALEALAGRPFSHWGATVRAACDVRTLFVDAARVFGPQKGASGQMVEVLSQRLRRVALGYRETYGTDPSDIPGSGAAGGLAGGLAVLGAQLVPGFALVASAVGLDRALGAADAVVTGEGRLDQASLAGKVVGSLFERAALARKPFVAVVGSSELGHGAPVPFVSLSELYGEQGAWARTAKAVSDVTADWLSTLQA